MGVLLGVSREAALKAVLPKLGEPRVTLVCAEPELQVVVVEGGDLFGLELYCDAAQRLELVALHHLHPVGPAITAGRDRG